MMQKIQALIQVYWKINWLRRSAITLFIFALLLVLLPVVIQYGATHQLKKMGATQADIDDINLNLFAGTFELQQLQFSNGKNESAHIDHVSVDLNMLDLLSSRMVIDTLQINGVKANVSRRKNGEISINGLLIPQDEKPAVAKSTEDNSTTPAFGINKLSIKDADFSYQETDFSQHGKIESLDLSNIKSWDSTATADLEASILLNEAPLIISASLNPFQKAPRFKGKLSLDSLSLSNFAKFYRDHLDKLQAKLSIHTDFEVSLSQTVSAKIAGTVEITDLDLQYQHINQTVQSIAWQGQTQLQDNGQLLVSGDLDIRQSHTGDQQQHYPLADFEHLKLSNLHMLNASVSFERLDLSNLKLIDIRHKDKNSSNHFVEIEKLALKNLKLEPASSSLNIGEVNLDNPRITLTLNSQKQVEHLEPLLKTVDGFSRAPQTSADQSTDPANDQPPLAIQISQLKLLKPGLVTITDNSVSPTYKSLIHLNQIDVSNISSENSASFMLSLKQRDYTVIDVKGDGMLFNPTEKLKLEAKITQLDLPPVTPYTSDAMGYGMKSGVVDLNIQLELNRRDIDSVIDLKIDSIEVVETNKQTAEQISSASGMSIDLAVSALKDSKNVIELKLPVKGNIDQPDFDLSLIINKAMGKAMKSATLGYLKHSLQPFGSLITLFSLAKAAADHISLPPIVFKTNSLDFQDQQDELINKITKVLQDRPGLKIKACGVSALEDQAAIRQALIEIEKAKLKESELKLKKESPEKAKQETPEIVIQDELIQQKMKELADNRAAKVKAFFLEKGGLDSGRILNCLSTTSLEKDSKPSVEMQI